MKETWNYERCVSVLNEELVLLKKISSAQDKVRQAVLNREWTDFDEKINEVGLYGDNFARLEEERVKIFLIIREGFGPDNSEEKPFYALISRLPMAEGRELSRLYRELKMESLKMRAINENFLAYLNEAKTIAQAYLEAVCPARGGKLYTRRGRRVSQDLRSMVINNRF